MPVWSHFFGSHTQRSTIAVPLEMVQYAAGLVSNPDSIDAILDKMRVITSGLTPGQQPSAEENKTLIQAYLQIEQFLTTKEPLRSFTKDELRARLAPELRSQIEEYENGKQKGGVVQA